MSVFYRIFCLPHLYLHCLVIYSNATKCFIKSLFWIIYWSVEGYIVHILLSYSMPVFSCWCEKWKKYCLAAFLAVFSLTVLVTAEILWQDQILTSSVLKVSFWSSSFKKQQTCLRNRCCHHVIVLSVLNQSL